MSQTQTEITYRKPEDTDLTPEQIKLAYDKLRPFKSEPQYLSDFPKKAPEVILLEKPVIESLSRVGYLYDPEQVDATKMDNTDHAFVADPKALETHTFYGLHTYGDHWSFFRPDLDEVIRLTYGVLASDDIERVYVTTQAWPSLAMHEFYDRKADRNRAKTTLHVVRRTVSASA